MKLLRFLEAILWIAASCALFYCIFSVGDALLTQERLARVLERTRSLGVNPKSLPTTTRPIPSNLIKANLVSAEGVAPLGLLSIPRIGLSAMVLEGVGSRTLRVGLGHVSGTSSPGGHGNVAIAGHRDTFFRPLRRIAPRDQIVFETSTHNYHYRVRSVEIVDPADIAVLKSRHSDELTLVTCYPFTYIGPAPKRFIVHADLAR
jgi:sortase A